jgi:hypothetical protein
MIIDRDKLVNCACIRCKYHYGSDIPVSEKSVECRYGPPTTLYFSGCGHHPRGAFPMMDNDEWCWRFDEE